MSRKPFRSFRVLLVIIAALSLLSPQPVAAEARIETELPSELREGAPAVGPEDGLVPLVERADDAEPLPPEPPILQADPEGPWVPGELVALTFTIEQPEPGELEAFLLQCVGTTTDQPCQYVGFQPIVDNQARFDDVRVARRLEVRRSDGDSETVEVVDCGVEACSFIITTQGGESRSVLPVNIDVDAPVPQVVATATPSSGLGSRDVVAVDVSGLPPLSVGSVRQCAGDDCSGNSVGEQVDENGELSLDIAVVRLQGGIDCAVTETCRLRVSGPTADYRAFVDLSFDPSIPPRPPVLTVEPNAGLLHNQEVLVTATDFAPGEFFQMRLCPVGEVMRSECQALFLDDFAVGADGSISGPLMMPRAFNETDCAAVECELVVDSNLGRVAVALDFDDTVPPPQVPNVRVLPDGLLTDGQQVTVEVENASGDGGIDVQVCTAEAGCNSIDYLSSPDDDGVFRTSFVARRMIPGADCAEVGACTVEIRGFAPLTFRLQAPLLFDADAPIGPAPHVSVFPSTGVWDGEQVTVSGSGLVAGQQFLLQQCQSETRALCSDQLGFVQSDRLGELSGQINVQSSYVVRRGAEVDCLTTSCSIVLTDQQTGEVAFDFRLTFAEASPRAGYVDQLECVAWPTESWPTGEVPAGVDADEVDKVIAEMLEGGTRSVVVIHGGRLVAEGYDDDVDENTIFNSFSVSKSFTSTVIGLLVQEGLLELDAPAPVPEWSDPDDPRAAITLRHLLDMASGLEWNESYSFDADTDLIRMLSTPDSASFAAEKPLDGVPGRSFKYSTGTTQILARIVSQTLDAYDDELLANLDARLFDRIGVDPTLGIDGIGVWRGGAVTNMTTRHFAKLGLLYLRGGVWEDEQFLDQAWVDYARSSGVHDSGYAAQFWNAGGGNFRAVGLFGQGVHIYPTLDLVLAVNSATGSGGGNIGGLLDLFRNAAPASCDAAASVLSDDAVTLQAAGKTRIDVLANDDGAGHDLRPATLAVVDQPASGTAEVVGGTITYTADIGFSGTDSFTYGVCITTPYCTTATVEVTVEPFTVEVKAPPTKYRKVRAGKSPRVNVATPDVPHRFVKAATFASQAIDCKTGEPFGPVEMHDLKLTRKKRGSTNYRTRWPIDPEWTDCRALSITLADGVSHTTGFRIRS